MSLLGKISLRRRRLRLYLGLCCVLQTAFTMLGILGNAPVAFEPG